MSSIVCWSTLSLVAAASLLDIRSRRIPNWLTVPFLVAGVGFGFGQPGMGGFTRSIGGIALAVIAAGGFCFMRGMGMGDLKLCAAVGAWVGFAQMGVALLVTAMAGGLMAVFWAASHRALGQSLGGASDLVFGFHRRGFRPHPTLTLDNPRGCNMPYAPAIAIGTLFSFFC